MPKGIFRILDIACGSGDVVVEQDNGEKSLMRAVTYAVKNYQPEVCQLPLVVADGGDIVLDLP